jgi:hypothetical protein
MPEGKSSKFLSKMDYCNKDDGDVVVLCDWTMCNVEISTDISVLTYHTNDQCNENLKPHTI